MRIIIIIFDNNKSIFSKLRCVKKRYVFFYFHCSPLESGSSKNFGLAHLVLSPDWARSFVFLGSVWTRGSEREGADRVVSATGPSTDP